LTIPTRYATFCGIRDLPSHRSFLLRVVQAPSMSVDREHVREFTEAFLEYVLPEDKHADRQYEPLASSERSGWTNPYAHDTLT
jgi:hypothetical protein